MLRHLLDLPAPADDVHMMCGVSILKARRNEHFTSAVALVNCVACLRAHAAKLALDVERLEAIVKDREGR